MSLLKDFFDFLFEIITILKDFIVEVIETIVDFIRGLFE